MMSIQATLLPFVGLPLVLALSAVGACAALVIVSVICFVSNKMRGIKS